MVEIKDGDTIYILKSTYSDPEEEYGVEYIVGMFLSGEEAKAKAKELKLGMCSIYSFLWGRIRVEADRE